MTDTTPYRIVSAASLFDGHDASIQMFRRLLQQAGAEVIHLGHNRSVHEVLTAALQEDADAVALSSYQGGHIEYFKYLKDELESSGASHIQIFGGGGGVIVPAEIRELESYGIAKIFSPEDGRRLGLEGIVRLIFDRIEDKKNTKQPARSLWGKIAEQLTLIENGSDNSPGSSNGNLQTSCPVIGITGPGGSGKSSLTDELLLRILRLNPGLKAAVLAVDPTRKKTGGALLGDRIRINSLSLFPDRLFFRSVAGRGSAGSLASAAQSMTDYLRTAGFDIVILESSGIGQADSEITDISDFSVYVMTAEYGAPTQLEKIAMLDFADLVAVNKCEKPGSEDAVRYVKKQMARNLQKFGEADSMPVYATSAGQNSDPGTDRFYNALAELLKNHGPNLKPAGPAHATAARTGIVSAQRKNYLSDIAETIRTYHNNSRIHTEKAAEIEALEKSKELIENGELKNQLSQKADDVRLQTDPQLLNFLNNYRDLKKKYEADQFTYTVRNKEIKAGLKYKTLSETQIPVVSLPPADSPLSALAKYYYSENLPGSFPYTAGVFPFKKADEDPIRMFAGEGGPERTNRRFHYLSSAGKAVRLSTAFDSVTLYGEDPAERPDIYGKIGNSGVSIPTLDDCKKLYSGFDLSDPMTSVSMTINGPAPAVLAFFLNTAVDQNTEKYLRENGLFEKAQSFIENRYRQQGLEPPSFSGNLPAGHDGTGLLLGLSGYDLPEDLISTETYENIKKETLSTVRGTVQADILKEDQAQNTCIFSVAFALRLMGDMQAFFIANQVKNFYSVSISGYHMAEAGANPVTQLAFTLANAFTYAEYYLSRGMEIDDFAPNFSFFFSNGLDAEYAVLGRVARRIWAIALRDYYGASERSQKLKYHIQTSGRSLHAQEIDFNDIRTTLQALYALYDNANSLHTNAYDEAITTPTEHSVRRAVAIQLIIQKELGQNQNQNPLQGSYFTEWLTAAVEQAVLAEFDELSHRGGVPGAMETMYQRSRIQDQSLNYESQKHSGRLPIIGVNTFEAEKDPQKENEKQPELIRSGDDEKKAQIRNLHIFQKFHAENADKSLKQLEETARKGENTFESLMHAVRYCSLGQISAALFQAGGAYRRNI